MNHMDENYWKNLAQSWIQSKQQTQQQNPIDIPPPPDINSYEPPSEDNHALADMEIEEVKEEEPAKLWNWQNSNFQIQQPPQLPQHLPVMHNFPNIHHHQLITKHMPPIIPEPPIINTSFVHSDDGASNNLVDMEMADSDNEGDDSNSNSASSGMMDAQKRKMLPHWIREGLEKMKREKELEIQRQQEEQKLKEQEANRKKLMEEALLEIEREKAAKSKYDSASSESENDDPKPQKTDKIIPTSVVTSEPVFQEVDGEEAYENMMLLVRKTLTSILLEVTNERIQEISSETLSKYRKKASASQSKPAIVGLGLGVYSSSSDEDSDNDDKNTSDQSDWEPDSVLRDRVRQKAISFEKRSRDVEEKLAKIAEMEDIRYGRRKSTNKSPEKSNRNDHDEQKSKNNSNYEKDGGEEKYETKVSSSSAGNSRSREKKTRFSDPKEGRSVTVTHVNVMHESTRNDNGIAPISLSSIYTAPPPPPIKGITPEKHQKEKSKKSKRRDSSSSSTSGSSSHRKKHKKHKKSSKHSKKSSKKRDRSRSRSKSRDRHDKHKTDRRSIESKNSVRSSESRSRHSRSRSRSRDRHRRRY